MPSNDSLADGYKVVMDEEYHCNECSAEDHCAYPYTSGGYSDDGGTRPVSACLRDLS